ncbi:MAG TPA: hypothetical protein VF841_10855 [Anaeromyxobacter sp.]
MAVFPVENLASDGAPEPGLEAEVARAAAKAGLDVVTGEPVERFLAAGRIRYTGGLSRDVARAAREQLGVDAVLIATVEQGGPGDLRIAMTMRLVTTADPPDIVWMDGFARTGDDAPGLLRLGVVTDPARLRREALDRLSRSLAAARRRAGPPGIRCAPDDTYAPKFSFRLPALDEPVAKTVVVVPFLNTSGRPNAGDIVRLEIMRQLAGVPGLRLVDPGEIREALLEYRIILRGGVSLVSAETMLDSLRADWVVSGEVRRFDETVAAAEFNVHILDRSGEDLAWLSRSYNDGHDGVWVFNVGAVSTTAALVCRMSSEIVERALRPRSVQRRAEARARPRPARR